MSPHVTVTIDLELAEPVSGVLASPALDRRQFTGWLELHALLEEVHSSAYQPGGDPPKAIDRGAAAR